MAQVNFTHQTPQNAVSFGFVNWIGAGCSLALVVGLIGWSIQLTLRDVAEVPVIRAMEGPMRVAPEDPGGLQAAYQGLSVNDIKAGGGAAPAPERIVLAPPPVELEPVAPEPVESTVETAQAPDPTAPYQSLDVAALAGTLANGDLAAAAAGLETDASAPARRPVARPSSLAQIQPVDVQATSARIDVDPASVAVGSRLVQLGAFDSEDQALSEWDRLYGSFGDYLEGKQRLIQKATSGGRDFYRLRVVGFDDGSDAQRFCSAFLARNSACIPVTAK